MPEIVLGSRDITVSGLVRHILWPHGLPTVYGRRPNLAYACEEESPVCVCVCVKRDWRRFLSRPEWS